jgi:ABC-type multidrug transport system fused ATPase/permease subunit
MLRKSLSLLPVETSRKLALMTGVQFAISSFDVLAILLLGLLSNAGLKYVQNESGNFPKWLIDLINIENYGFERQFLLLSVLTFILFTGRTLLAIYGNKRILHFLGERGSFASNTFLAMVFESRPRYVTNKNSQELLYGVTSGVDNLTLNYLGAVALLVSECFFLISISITVFVLEPLTGVCAFLIFSCSFWLINKSTSSKGRKYAEELSQLSISYNQKLLERIYVYRELILRNQAFSSTSEIREKRRTSSLLRAQLLYLPMMSKYLFELVLIFGGAVVSLAQLLVSDALSAISALVMFLAAASRILPSLIRAQASTLTIKQSEGSASVTLNQLEELQERRNILEATIHDEKNDETFVPCIEINNLNFAYPENSSFTIENISLSIKPEAFVAIVGESGSGKTTLIDLMLGMNDPKSGNISISGLSPLKAAKKWPGKIAYVPQNIAILDGSIRENITLEKKIMNLDNDVVAALEKAKLLNDTNALPKKLDEIVGERGLKLSGGQRQRLGIARALFTKPELIVFDEATSALDPITEKAVTEAIYGRAKGVTLIVIAHRLSTVKNAGLVVYLEKGKVVAKGSFEEVRKVAPKFDEQAKLVNL